VRARKIYIIDEKQSSSGFAWTRMAQEGRLHREYITAVTIASLEARIRSLGKTGKGRLPFNPSMVDRSPFGRLAHYFY